jgi:nucleotide-binding universal stress UspA family protein
MFKVIIWASDGSEHADSALGYAQKLAEASSAKLIATHVREITVGRSAGYPVQVDEEEVEQKVQGQVNTLKDAGIDAEYEQPGRPLEAPHMPLPTWRLLANADLIVVHPRPGSTNGSAGRKRHASPLACRELSGAGRPAVFLAVRTPRSGA